MKRTYVGPKGRSAFPRWSVLVFLMNIVAGSAFVSTPLESKYRGFGQMAQKIAVVTGANKGIGLEIARILGKAPGTLCILGCRNVELGTKAEQDLKKDGCNVAAKCIDISNPQSIASFAEMMKSEFGGIDILVNNAAIAFKAADPTPFQQQARPTIDVNFFGTVNVCDALVPLIRNGGRISMVSSQAGPITLFSPSLQERFRAPDLTKEELCQLMKQFVTDVEAGGHQSKGWPNTCYGTSKAGVTAYTRVLARELKSRDILVNACCPGYCATDMSSHKGTRSAAQGADTPAYLALLPAGSPTGEFWYDRKVVNWAGA